MKYWIIERKKELFVVEAPDKKTLMNILSDHDISCRIVSSSQSLFLAHRKAKTTQSIIRDSMAKIESSMR